MAVFCAVVDNDIIAPPKPTSRAAERTKQAIALSVTQPRQIARYEKAFRILIGQSARGGSARALIRTALESRRGQPWECSEPQA